MQRMSLKNWTHSSSEQYSNPQPQLLIGQPSDYQVSGEILLHGVKHLIFNAQLSWTILISLFNDNYYELFNAQVINVK
jgi:hypothetical protein